jgi:hypothetical protein
MRITKLDAAEREIITAVRLLFNGGDPIAVCLLASAARDITSRLCEKRGIKSFFDFHPHSEKRELYRLSNRHSNYFKHANTDDEDVLEDFDEEEADAVLYVAVHDFGRLCGGLPVEARAFGMWFAARLDPSGHGKEVAEVLVGIETMSRSRQLGLGKLFVDWMRMQPQLQMTYSTK